jgi:serine/arginine repetitive matrix protein 2
MATKTQVTSSSRVRFGFGHKHSRTRVPPPPQPPEHADDEGWYIPYNGPYELPPANPPSQNRDSWDQLLGSVLGNLGSAKSSDVGHEWSDGRMASGHRHPAGVLPSSGAYSSHPYRMYTAPNAAAAPGPAAMSSQGRAAVSQPLRGSRSTLITSAPTAFANIDNTGGVGESPTPVQRSSHPYASPPSSALNRLSLGSFLTFGGSSRKSRSDSLPASRRPSTRRSRNVTLIPDPLQSNRALALDAQPSRSHSPLSLGQTVERRPRQRSHTLMGTTSFSHAKPPTPSHDSSANSYYNRESSLSTHPYAHTFLPSRTESPRRAPIVPPSSYHPSGKGKGVDRSYQYPRPPAPDTLNNKTEIPAHLKPASRTSLFKTISAPNLRNLPRGISANNSTSSRGKSRWLSPETWCDALLFPRPRFMEYIDDEPPQSSRHRQTTLTRSSDVHSNREHPKFPQTALRASYSATNLHAPISEASRGPPRAEPMLMLREKLFNADGHSSPARPRSFAQDDLALPSPVPSLARSVTIVISYQNHDSIPTDSNPGF